MKTPKFYPDKSQKIATTKPRRWLLAVLVLSLLGVVGSARAAFHAWEVTEVYSSADGSVQFIEISALGSGQQFLGTYSASVSSANSAGANTFTFDHDLPGDTFSRTCILGTTNLASIPGGIVPDYIIPPNFIRRPIGGGAAVVSFNASGSTADCANLPSDGRGAVFVSGGISTVVSTNSPRNFNGDANSIIPTKIDNITKSGGNVVLTFATASGPNSTPGSNYAVEARSGIDGGSWNTVSNVTGNGTVKTVAIPASTPDSLFFRLRVP